MECEPYADLISPLSATVRKRRAEAFRHVHHFMSCCIILSFRCFPMFKFEMVYVVLPRICVGCDVYMGDVMFVFIYIYATRAMPFVCEGQGLFIRLQLDVSNSCL